MIRCLEIKIRSQYIESVHTFESRSTLNGISP